MCKHTWRGSSKRTARIRAAKSRGKIDLRDAKSRYSSISIFCGNSTIFTTFASRIVTFLQIYNRAINIRTTPERIPSLFGNMVSVLDFWYRKSYINVFESKTEIAKQSHITEYFLSDKFALQGLNINTRETVRQQFWRLPCRVDYVTESYA